MEITPEIQAQLDEAKSHCIFCKILSGEIPSHSVHSDGVISALLDVNPQRKGHTLIMPREHYPIMPYLPQETFIHLFGMLPKLSFAMRHAATTLGTRIVIANGAAAGQRSPHFLIHLLPEDSPSVEIAQWDHEHAAQAYALIKQNLPLMLRNHFTRAPASWRHASFDGGVYEDEKTLCEMPQSKTLGHLVITPKSQIPFEEMSPEDAAHLFFVASYAATALFEGLGAHATNIILTSKETTRIHVIPRYQDDGLDFFSSPLTEKPDATHILRKASDGLFAHDQASAQKSAERERESESAVVDDLPVRIHQEASKPSSCAKKPKKHAYDPQGEIIDAIRRIKDS